MKAKSLLIGTVLALCGTGANAQWVCLLYTSDAADE